MIERSRRRVVGAIAWLVLACSATLAIAGPLGPGLELPSAAALAIAGAALALLALLRGAARTGGVLAGALLAATLATLASHLLAGNLPSRALSAPMPPATAFAALLLGVALGALALPQRLDLARHVAQAGAAAALLLTLVDLAGGLGATAPRFPPGTGRAAGGLLLLLGGATFLLAIRTLPEEPDLQRINRYSAWTPTLLATLVFVVWTHLEAREWHERANAAALARATIAQDVAARIKLRGDALQRLADRWQVYGPPSRGQWEEEARMYLRDFPALHAVILADTGYVVRWRVARPGSPDLIGQSIAVDDGRMAAFEEAARSGRVRLSPSIQLRSGGTGLIFVTAVRDGSGVRGYMTASMRASELLEVADTPALRDFAVRLRDARGIVAGQTDPAARVEGPPVQASTFDALGQRWSLEVWPRTGYVSRMRSGLPETVFLLGLVAVGLSSAALAQLRRSVASSAAARGYARRLTATLESITDAFFTLDGEWRFTYVNTEAERLLQRTRDELLGRNIWAEFPQAVGSSFQLHYEQARREGVTVLFEAYYEPLERWFGVRAYPARAGIAVYFQDVTEIIRSREALRESERELRALAESMPQMVWMAGPDGSTTYFNARWYEYSGLPPEQSLGFGWLRSIHPDDVDAMRRAWARSRDEGTDYGEECRVRRADGAYRWMLVRAVRFLGPDGSTLKWMGTCTDIDEIRRSSQAVRLSEERFRLLSEASQDAIWDWDVDAATMWWSESFGALFGHGPAPDRRFASWSDRIHPDDRDHVLAQLLGAIADGRAVWAAEYRFRRADGTWARVVNRGYVIRDGSGRATRLLGGMSDVTGRMALEDQLRQSQRLESVGQLTGGVAHDFNNLLTVILGNAETLAEELADDPALGPAAAMVVSAAERGADLTQRLLAFGRKQALAPVPVDLRLQLGELDPLLRRTLGEHIDIRIVLEAGVWNPMVDPAQLDNALLNLCLNARDAMPGGGRLTLSARNAVVRESTPEAAELAPGDYVVLTVEDTGTGIAPEHAGRLFEPFFTTKEIGKGTGLGLPMVYGFLKQSGGHIQIDSTPGHGTTVRLHLPRAEREAMPSPRQAAAPVAAGHASILLVEDDALVRRYALAQLRSLGYRVHDAEGAAGALEVLRSDQPVDLLFTDVVMPGTSGPQLVEQALRLRPGLRVLYTSGYAEEAIAHHGRLEPGVDLLLKPYAREELARRITAALLRPR